MQGDSAPIAIKRILAIGVGSIGMGRGAHSFSCNRQPTACRYQTQVHISYISSLLFLLQACIQIIIFPRPAFASSCTVLFLPLHTRYPLLVHFLPVNMQFSTLLAFLSAVALVAASPVALESRQFDQGVVGSKKNEHHNEGLNNGQSNLNKGTVKGDYTVSQAISSCGNGQLNCCNYVEQTDQTAEGLVGLAAQALGPIAVGCSPIAASKCLLGLQVAEMCIRYLT